MESINNKVDNPFRSFLGSLASMTTLTPSYRYHAARVAGSTSCFGLQANHALSGAPRFILH